MENITKNKYYLIKNNGEPWAYLSAKKDFYIEGMLISNQTFMAGYFNDYNSVVAAFINDDTQYVDGADGIHIKSKTKNKEFNFDGIPRGNDYILYKAFVDVSGDTSCETEIGDSMEVILIMDEEIIKDIKHCIKLSKKCLTGRGKELVSSFERNRVGNLKESVSDSRWILTTHGESDHYTTETLNDLDNYLKILKEKYYSDINNKTKVKVRKRKQKKDNK